MAHIALSDDRLAAHLVLEDGERLAPDALSALLAAAGVCHGVLDAAIAEATAAVGPGRFEVARGTPAEPGRDARVDYAFGGGRRRLRPRIAEDGSADFRNLGLVVSVAAGQVLATRVPPVPGTDGLTVTGAPVRPRPPRDASLRAGRGAEVSADGLTVVATTAGNPHREGSVVLVRQEYRHHGNVGLATGHLDFEGDLVIRGDVEVQSVVRATGDVTIHGHVEGAHVTAGGTIRIDGGVRRGSALVACNDVVARFVEGSRLRCGGSLALEEDLVHTTAEVGASAIIGGAVVGGMLHVAERVEARVLGARLGTVTDIVIAPPGPSEERLAIGRERAAIQANLARIAPKIREAHAALGRDDLPSPDLDVFRQVLELAAGLTARDAALAEREAAMAQAPAQRPCVLVREGMHPGVRLRLGQAHWRVSAACPAGMLVEQAGAIQLLGVDPAPTGAAHPAAPATPPG